MPKRKKSGGKKVVKRRRLNFQEYCAADFRRLNFQEGGGVIFLKIHLRRFETIGLGGKKCVLATWTTARLACEAGAIRRLRSSCVLDWPARQAQSGRSAS